MSSLRDIWFVEQRTFQLGEALRGMRLPGYSVGVGEQPNSHNEDKTGRVLPEMGKELRLREQLCREDRLQTSNMKCQFPHPCGFRKTSSWADLQLLTLLFSKKLNNLRWAEKWNRRCIYVWFFMLCSLSVIWFSMNYWDADLNYLNVYLN